MLEADLRDRSWEWGCLRIALVAHWLNAGKAARSSGRWYGHHRVQLLQWMPQRRPSPWPRPRQSWHHCWCRGRLPDTAPCTSGILGALAPLGWSREPFIITYDYSFCYYTVFTLLLRIITYLLKPIITKSLLHIITSLLHHYNYIIITNDWNR